MLARNKTKLNQVYQKASQPQTTKLNQVYQKTCHTNDVKGRDKRSLHYIMDKRSIQCGVKNAKIDAGEYLEVSKEVDEEGTTTSTTFTIPPNPPILTPQINNAAVSTALSILLILISIRISFETISLSLRPYTKLIITCNKVIILL